MHESVVKTKRLTEAAAAAAIAAMFVLLKLAAPFLVVVTMIVSPAPIAAVACFSGMRWALGMTGGPEIGLTTAVYAGALGLAMGYGFRRGFSYRKTMGLTLAAYLVEMTYKIIFSVQVLGLPVLTGGAQERYTEFLHWVTEAIHHGGRRAHLYGLRGAVAGAAPPPGRRVLHLSQHGALLGAPEAAPRGAAVMNREGL